MATDRINLTQKLVSRKKRKDSQNHPTIPTAPNTACTLRPHADTQAGCTHTMPMEQVQGHFLRLQKAGAGRHGSNDARALMHLNVNVPAFENAQGSKGTKTKKGNGEESINVCSRYVAARAAAVGQNITTNAAEPAHEEESS